MFRCLALVLVFAIPAVAVENQATGKVSRVPGRVIVAKVVGTVSATGPGGQTKELKAKDEIGEKHTVVSGPGSSAVLIFSNGSTVFVKPDTTFEIERFLQDPFAEAYNVTTATAEPTTSVTSLKIQQGSLTCKVKKLNTTGATPSSFTVNTPVGAAGIRGTIIDVEYRPGQGGIASYSLVVTEGAATFTPDGGGPATQVESGRQLTFEARVQTNPVTGESRPTEQPKPREAPAAPEKVNSIQQAVVQMDNSSQNVSIPPPPPPATDGPGIPPSPPVVPELPLNPNTSTDANPPTTPAPPKQQTPP
jgi:hypothetical protein